MSAELDSGLVPFSDRVRSLQVARVGLAAGVTAAAALGLTHMSVVRVAVVSLFFLAGTAVSLAAPQLESRRWAITLSGTALLVDGLYLAVTTYGGTGFATPVAAIAVLHVVAVTLLSSFRTGFKVALWHTLLGASVVELQRGGVIGDGEPSVPHALVVLALLWAGTLATAVFASVNEREIRRHNADLLALSRLSYRLEATLGPNEVGAALIEAVCDEQGIERAVLLGVVGEQLERVAGRGDEAGAEGRPSSDVMVRRAVQEHRTLRVARLDPARDPWLTAALPDATNLLLVPVYADGSVAAVLVAEHGGRLGSRVALRVQSMLERYTSHAALALTNARLLARMRRLAETDGLTGVANRRTFDETLRDELHVAAARTRPLSLVLVDLDHFKQLNDTRGHQTGDAALKDVAAALQRACRASDLVARYGGEEFAVVLPGADRTSAAVVAERLREMVEALTTLGAPGQITASLGVATSVDGLVAPHEITEIADRALYRSKENGRNQVTVLEVLAGHPVP